MNDTVALLLIVALASLYLPESTALDIGPLLTVLGLVLFGGILTGILIIRYVPVKYYPDVLQSVVSKIKVALVSLFSVPVIGMSGFVLSLAIQSIFVGLNILIAEAMGIGAPFYLWFFAWPLAKLIALVPVSLGGIGVREAALVTILLPFGVDSTLVVAQGLSWQVVLIFSGLFAGLAVTLLPKNRDRNA